MSGTVRSSVPSEAAALMPTRDQVTELVERMLRSTGRRTDLRRPLGEAVLSEEHRLNVALKLSSTASHLDARRFP